jgi:hypothetical protein
MLSAACLLLMSSITGQYAYYPVNSYAPGYQYGYRYYARTPLPMFDPMRYNRFYSGEGYYRYSPPVIANPQVINFTKPVTTLPGTAGLVVAVNEQTRQITLQLPASTATVSYGPTTHFLANDGDFPVIKPGNLINVNQNTITILRRSQ